MHYAPTATKHYTTTEKFPQTPDFEIMETFISAIQKLVIKDVLRYADRKIAGTKKIVGV